MVCTGRDDTQQARYVCTEPLELTDMTPDGLAARLGRNEVPDLLQPVELNSADNLTVWRVKR